MPNKAQHIAWVAAHPVPRTTHRRFERLDVHLIGSVGIATGIVAATDTGRGAARRTMFTDVFAHRDGQWRAVNAQETPVAPR